MLGRSGDGGWGVEQACWKGLSKGTYNYHHHSMLGGSCR